MNYTMKIVYSDKSWNELYYGRGDMVTVRARRDVDKMAYSEFTEPAIISTMNFAVPNSKQVPQWISLTLPFQRNVWLLTFTVASAIYIVSQIFVIVKCKLRFTQDRRIFSVILLSLQISDPRQPVSHDLRFIFISFVWFLMIIYSIYQGSIIDFLTNPP